MDGISTICLVGFPPEAVHPRELKNLCRFLPGFEGAHVSFAGGGKGSTLFVKFQTTEEATAAMGSMHGIPFDVDLPEFTLKAEWARRQMEVRPNSPMPAAAGHGAPAPFKFAGGQKGAGGYNGPPSQRVGAAGAEITTIVCLAIAEKGIAPGDLETFFQGRPGYMLSQMNDRINGMFVKFSSHWQAQQAMDEANTQGVGAEWARRNLDDEKSERGMPAMSGAPALGAGAYNGTFGYGGGGFGGGGYAGPPSKGKGKGSSTEELVTIAVLGLPGKEATADQMQEWFAQRPGFDKAQMNERIGGLFVKFTSALAAETAMLEANTMSWGVEWARRNLDDDSRAKGGMQTFPGFPPAQNAAPVAAWGKGGGPAKRMRTGGDDIDTITVMQIAQKEQTHGNLQEWFSARPGYVALQVNGKIDAMFVKFSSKDAAEMAIADSNAQNFGAEWARRNLDL